MAKSNQKTPIPKFIISADDIGAQIWFYIVQMYSIEFSTFVIDILYIISQRSK